MASSKGRISLSLLETSLNFKMKLPSLSVSLLFTHCTWKCIFLPTFTCIFTAHSRRETGRDKAPTSAILGARMLESSPRLLTGREGSLKHKECFRQVPLPRSCGYSPTSEACSGTCQARNAYNCLRLPGEMQCPRLNKLVCLHRRPGGKLGLHIC